MAFPTNLPSYTITAGTDTANTAGGSGLSPLLNSFETDITAIGTKLGTGASTPVSDSFLIGDGTGTSSWSSLTSAQLRARISDETGTGSAVFATSPTLVTPTIASIVNTGTLTLPTSTDTLVGRATTDTLTNKTLTTPTIASFANANHDHSNSAGGGQLNGASAITDGTITPAELTSGAGSSWAWQTWSPTWTNLSVGNGTLVAKAIQTGKLMTCRIKLTFGTTTSITGAPRYTLPATSASDYEQHTGIGTGSAYDQSVGSQYIMNPTWYSTTEGAMFYTSGGYANVSSTAPFTWATSDVLSINFMYEVA